MSVTETKHLPFSCFRNHPEVGNPCEKVLLGDFFQNYLPEDIFGQLQKSIASDSSFTQRTYDAQGNVKTTTDEADRTTTFEYDHENRVTKTTFTDGSFTNVEYDSRGRRTASVDRNGNRTEYEYDNAGNNTVVRDALGNETTYEYDVVNRRTAMIDALNQRTEYVYDDYDRLVRTDYHDGTYSTIEYDNAGRKIAEVDQEQKRTEFTYDSTGNLRTVTDAMNHVTEYTYDNSNNRLTQTDANNHTTTMGYDKLNRLVSRTYPNSDQETFAYDANGNIVSKVDGEGDSTVYTYDNRNREILRKYTNSGHTVRTVYTIDSKRDSVIDHRGVTTYEWGDCCGQLVRVNHPDGTYLQYEYDDNKNKTAMITPWSRTEYRYDSLNRMDSVIADNGDVTLYFYNAVGNRDSISNANGTGVKYTYDDLNRLTTIDNYGADGAVISSFNYELNNAGIRTAVTEADGSRVDYGYDDCYKLTSEVKTGTDPYSISYTYDNVGNRITKDHDGVVTTYTYNIRDQLESESSVDSSITYTYDRDGRMVTKANGTETTTYSWQDEDRMTGITTAAGTISYIYDADNARVAVDDGSTVMNYLIDTRQQYAQVVAEYENTTSPTVQYVFGLERISQDRSGRVATYVADGQGSIRQLTFSSGSITDQYSYFAFGEELSSSGSTENEFRYVGEQFDPNAGFYYNRNRWYRPQIGRFTSVDSWSGDPQSPVSLHRYLYGKTSPVSFSDPSGKSYTYSNVMNAIAVGGILIATGFTIQQIYQHTTGDVSFDFNLASGLLRMAEDLHKIEWEINKASIAMAVSIVVTWDQVIEMIKQRAEQLKKTARKKNKQYAGLQTGPSKEYGAKYDNWTQPFKTGSHMWYRDGGPYPGRLNAFGIWCPPEGIISHLPIGELDLHTMKEYGSALVLHAHVGDHNGPHLILGIVER